MVDQNITQLLDSVRNGNDEAVGQLVPQLYSELHKLARYQMQGEQAGHTLQATALVNEAYIRLLKQESAPNNKAHFMALSAQAMRRILVDHARGRNREKRGGEYLQISLSDLDSDLNVTEQGLLELHDGLRKLAEFDERAEKALELMFFGGLTYEEIADVLSVGRSTIYEDIKAAKAWLAVQMGSK